MMDVLRELQTIGLTALFNPTFLFLLIVLFFLGRLVGWMTRNINVWKFLAVAYFGIFLFRPLQDAGLVIGGVFILGVASMYLDLFRGIFMGRQSGPLSAKSFKPIFTRKEHHEKPKRDGSSRLADGSRGAEDVRAAWREEAKARAKKPKEGSASDRKV